MLDKQDARVKTRDLGDVIDLFAVALINSVEFL